MTNKLSYLTAALTLAAAGSSPAFAQMEVQLQQPQHVEQPGTNNSKEILVEKNRTPDPNEVLCEKQQDTSSRLVSQRVCQTRAQWADQRRQQQQDIYQIQIRRGCNGAQGC